MIFFNTECSRPHAFISNFRRLRPLIQTASSISSATVKCHHLPIVRDSLRSPLLLLRNVAPFQLLRLLILRTFSRAGFKTATLCRPALCVPCRRPSSVSVRVADGAHIAPPPTGIGPVPPVKITEPFSGPATVSTHDVARLRGWRACAMPNGSPVCRSTRHRSVIPPVHWAARSFRRRRRCSSTALRFTRAEQARRMTRRDGDRSATRPGHILRTARPIGFGRTRRYRTPAPCCRPLGELIQWQTDWQVCRFARVRTIRFVG